MASLFESFVCETASAPGTSSSVTLLGAAAGLPVRAFATAGYGDGDRVYYKITDNSGLSEEGLGTYHTAGPTLARDTVLANTSGTTSRLNFTSSPTYIFAHPASARLAAFDVNLDLTLQRNLLFAGGAVLQSHLTGLTLSRTAADTIGIARGVCLDSTNTTPIILTTSWTKKTAGTWASGTGSNGMGSGLTIANNTWYHVFAIIKAGAHDVFFDTSITAANAPSGTTAYRRLGSFKTNGSAQIIDFLQIGDEFIWRSGISDISTTLLSNTPALFVISVPPGVQVLARVRLLFSNSATGTSLTAYSPEETTTPTSASMNTASAGNNAWAELLIRTNTLQHIEAFSAEAANNSLTGYTIGYFDDRGRFD